MEFADSGRLVAADTCCVDRSIETFTLDGAESAVVAWLDFDQLPFTSKLATRSQHSRPRPVEQCGHSLRAHEALPPMARIAKTRLLAFMTTMNVSLPNELKSYVDEQVGDGGYGSTSEYVRDLIRRDKDRRQLRRVLLDGAASSPGPIADASYFASLRDGIRSNT